LIEVAYRSFLHHDILQGLFSRPVFIKFSVEAFDPLFILNSVSSLYFLQKIRRREESFAVITKRTELHLHLAKF
jgi:hypothetical protein